MKTATVHLNNDRVFGVHGFEHFNTVQDNSGNVTQYEFTNSSNKVVALFSGNYVVGVFINDDKKGKK